MNRVTNLLAWGAAAIVAALAVLNWSTLTSPAPLNLVVAQIQAPLGVVLLGVAAVLAALFFLASLGNQFGSLLETRRLLKEIQRVQDLADKAESSRIENLRKLIVSEFRLLNERRSFNAPVARPAVSARESAAVAVRRPEPAGRVLNLGRSAMAMKDAPVVGSP